MKHILFIILSFLYFSSEAQQTEYVDFKTANADLYFDSQNNSKNQVFGLITYEFEILKDVDSILIDAKNFERIEYRLDKSVRDSLYNGKYIIVKHKFKAKTKHVLDIAWHAKPKKAIYFVKKDITDQIWTQGQGKYTSNWLPSIDDMNDKIEFDLSITYKNDYEVLANGELVNKERGEHTTKWHYNMQKPMSSYLVALAIGKYDKKELKSKSGIPIELYYYPEDSAKVEPTYRYTKQMFDFLEEEIGVPYPWQNYKQVPVKDFLYSGMENTSLTIFSDDFMIDDTSFIDKNYVNVNAHELAHQWFGDLVTETEGKHHWLQEGFATYYALLAERDIFGEDYYYYRLYEYAQELLSQEDTGQATALLDPKASSVTFYKKGAWALHILNERIGAKAFKKAIKNYLKKHAFKNVNTEDFIAEAEKTSGEDLSKFETNWLTALILPKVEMEASLNKNETTAFLLTMEDTPYLSYRIDENGYVPSSVTTTQPSGFYPIKLAVLEEVFTKLDYPGFDSLLQDAFNSEDIKVRQFLAQRMTTIPMYLKKQYETLLHDKSYITIESALYNLSTNFPNDRIKYLNSTKDIYGFNDKNVRILWLVLALYTKDYNEAEKENYYKELVMYTSSDFGFQTRQNAFHYLNSINAFNETTIKNLIEASKHHNWRFKSFAKKMLETLSENEKYKQLVEDLKND